MEKESQSSWSSIINLLSDLVVFHHYDFNEFLKKFLLIVSTIVPVDSCLIYFHDKENKRSTLIASNKSRSDDLGNIVMDDGEGITGWVATHKKPVAIEKEAFKDSRFKYFKELPEDRYESFLSVPILNEDGVVGVINFQHKTPYTFTNEQIQVIEAIGKIISSAFINITLDKKIVKLEGKLEERKVIEKAKGLLMKVRNISEDEAFKIIRQEAMNKRKSMKEIAEAVIIVYQ